jgi:hypothetical protein
LAYADDVNIVGKHIDTIQRNTKALLDASKEVGLEENTKKTEYILVSKVSEGRTETEHKDREYVLRKRVKVKISGNNTYRSKLYS